MAKQPEVSLAIPIYNEEDCIGQTIDNLDRVFKQNKIDYELVLVNHGSWDKTDEVLAEKAKKNKRLRVHNLPKNLGWGGGITYGFEHSNGKIIGFTCADEEVSAEDTYKLYKALIDNFDKLDSSKAIRVDRKDGKFRKTTSGVFNFLVKARFGLPIKDMNGYPLFFKAEMYERVKTKETDDMFDLDLKGNIIRRGYKMIEIPVEHHKRGGGVTTMKLFNIADMVFRLIKYSLKSHK